MSKLFPVTLIVIQSLAAAVYFWRGDLGRGVYWVAADLITYAVTFLVH